MAPEIVKNGRDLTYEAALELLRKYIRDEKTIHHSEVCAEEARGLAEKMLRKHPELSVDPEKARIGGLLHDIGKSRAGEHEVNSMEILLEEGLPEYANIVVHSYPYEIYLLRGERKPEYLPTSLENKIIIYADFLRDPDGNLVTMEDRIAEIKMRKKDQTQRMKALCLAEPRLLKLKAEIEALL